MLIDSLVLGLLFTIFGRYVAARIAKYEELRHGLYVGPHIFTVSHLRFGKQPITSTYLIDEADFVSCSSSAYVNQYDLLKGLKNGGTFLLNCKWSVEELEKKLPAFMKKYFADNNINLYIINSTFAALK